MPIFIGFLSNKKYLSLSEYIVSHCGAHRRQCATENSAAQKI